MAPIPNSNSHLNPQLASHPHYFVSGNGGRHVLEWQRIGRNELLNQAYARIAQSVDAANLHGALDDLISTLAEIRENLDHAAWSDWVKACRKHRLIEMLHEDPFTRRAFQKPRGYAGDAVLLDFIYGIDEMWPRPETSHLGQIIFDYTTRSPAPEGVRARRAYVASRIDRLAEKVSRPDILSVAAGHFREALMCRALKRRELGRVVAVDSDSKSMDLVDTEYGPLGVETQVLNIRSLLTQPSKIGPFDLIYSMGLFDYLGDGSSRRLVSLLFEDLKPNGTLIVANFMPGIRDVGYMETFMDWRLIYRTRREMMEMTMEVEQEKIKRITISAEESQNIMFLEVTRK